MSERPAIGLLMDYQEMGDFSSRPHYALRCSYFDAVWHAGGLPIDRISMKRGTLILNIAKD